MSWLWFFRRASWDRELAEELLRSYIRDRDRRKHLARHAAAAAYRHAAAARACQSALYGCSASCLASGTQMCVIS